MRQGRGGPEWSLTRDSNGGSSCPVRPWADAGTESWRRACPLWACPPATNGDDEIESAPKLSDSCHAAERLGGPRMRVRAHLGVQGLCLCGKGLFAYNLGYPIVANW